jgi:hypothetical protein
VQYSCWQRPSGYWRHWWSGCCRRTGRSFHERRTRTSQSLCKTANRVGSLARVVPLPPSSTIRNLINPPHCGRHLSLSLPVSRLQSGGSWLPGSPHDETVSRATGECFLVCPTVDKDSRLVRVSEMPVVRCPRPTLPASAGGPAAATIVFFGSSGGRCRWPGRNQRAPAGSCGATPTRMQTPAGRRAS